MRRLDEYPIDPEVAAALDAIDATLAGDAVDPRHAELAELALLLAAERPEMDAGFADSLDERVERRFAAPQPAAGSGGAHRPLRGWLAPAAGLGSAALAAAVVVVILAGGSTGTHPRSAAPLPAISSGPARASSGSAHAASVPAQALKSASGSASTSASGSPSTSASGSPSTSASGSPSTSASGSLSTSASGSASSAGGSTSSASGSLPTTASGQASSSSAAAQPGPILQPPANGRKIIQSAQLALSTAPSRIDTVAQEVFDVVGQENGIVSSSTVTATGGTGGYAQFQLSVPSSALPQTMAALSTLRYAHVSSRTDTTQDVNDQYQSDVNRLADARALRTSLLKQLANATTQAQIDSLTAQIHDAEASISSDQATLRQLEHQINFSQITLTINSPVPVPVPVASGSGGFTLHTAAHDAGRVLTVAAGVALIALAALVPLALVGALGWWVTATLRRRRREQALDTV